MCSCYTAFNAGFTLSASPGTCIQVLVNTSLHVFQYQPFTVIRVLYTSTSCLEIRAVFVYSSSFLPRKQQKRMPDSFDVSNDVLWLWRVLSRLKDDNNLSRPNPRLFITRYRHLQQSLGSSVPSQLDSRSENVITAVSVAAQRFLTSQHYAQFDRNHRNVPLNVNTSLVYTDIN